MYKPSRYPKNMPEEAKAKYDELAAEAMKQLERRRARSGPPVAHNVGPFKMSPHGTITIREGESIFPPKGGKKSRGKKYRGKKSRGGKTRRRR